MDAIITITGEGQATPPIDIRRQLGLGDSEGALCAHPDEDTGKSVPNRSPTLDEVGKRVSRYIKPGTAPLVDVHEFYQSRRPRIR